MKKMKNNNINKTGLIIGAFCLIMVSCKAPSLTPTEKIELPEFYMDRETDILPLQRFSTDSSSKLQTSTTNMSNAKLTPDRTIYKTIFLF